MVIFNEKIKIFQKLLFIFLKEINQNLENEIILLKSNQSSKSNLNENKNQSVIVENTKISVKQE